MNSSLASATGVTRLAAGVLLLACASPVTSSSADMHEARADSIRHLVIAMERTAVTLARTHLDVIDADPAATPDELFDALALYVDAHAEHRKRDEVALDRVFARLRKLAAGPPAHLRRSASIARLEGARARGQGDFAAVRIWLAQAESLLKVAGAHDEPEYAGVLKHQALWMRGSGRMEDSERVLLRAASILERRCGAESDSLWDVLGYRASNFRGPGSAIYSLALHDRALEMHLRLFGRDSPRVAQTLYNKASIELSLGLDARARESVERLMPILDRFREDAPGWQIGSGLTAYGIALEIAGEPERAERAYFEAIDVVTRDHGETHAAARFPMIHRASLWMDQGRLPEVRAELARLGRCFAGAGDSVSNIYFDYEDLATRCALADGDTASARARLTARGRIEELHPSFGDAVGYRLAGRLMESWFAWLTGDAELAAERALEACALERGMILKQAGSLGTSDALSLRGSITAAQAAALLSITAPATPPGRVEHVLDAVIRSRGLVLDAIFSRRRDLMAVTDPRAQALVDSLTDLRTRRANATFASATRPVDDVSLDERERHLLGELERLKPAFSRIGRENQIGLDEVRRALVRDEALVSCVRYESRGEALGSGRDALLRETRYAAFVVRGSSFPVGETPIAFVDLGPAAAVDSLVHAWRAEIGRRNVPAAVRTTAIRVAGEALRARVLDPLRTAIGSATRLAVVPEGSLAIVAFDMLPEPDRRLLVERDLEVCLLATERDLVDDASSVAERPQALVAFGGADFTTARRGPSSHEPGTRPAPAPVATLSMADLVEPSGTIADLPLRFDPAPCAGSKRRFAPLPQSAIEVSEVGTLARAAGLDALVLVGAEASEAAFKQLAPGRAYVHLASHGFWLDDTCHVASRAAGSGLLRSGIVLAGANAGVVDPATGEDGILTAEEIGGLDLRGTQVLVLSACETGLGEGVPWEGVVGVKRAFRGAGAEALVTSLWKVDDRAAREWMREFYHALWSKPGDPGRAGRAATRALVARDRAAGREPDPFTCGAFVVTASGPGR